MSQYDTYLHALIWTCRTCGFAYFGGQPKMECPVCESYKTNFVALPQHHEQAVRGEFPENPPNHRDSRARRLELLNSEGDRKNQVAGRILPAASGNHMDPSIFD